MIAAALALCTSCFPVLDDVPTLVSAPRVLAVRVEPPEQEPTKRVALDALIATPDGTGNAGAVDWSFCLRPRTLAERNGVAPECLPLESDALQAITGTTAEVPLDACARFGPNPPPSTNPDEPPPRPADPDPTGGYYLPTRAFVSPERVEGAIDALFAFGFARVRCDLAGAPREVFRDFQLRYTNNKNPVIEAIELFGGAMSPLERPMINAGAQVTLRVRWTSESVELYPYYDSLEVKLIDRFESLSVAWFSSAGRFASERSGRTEDESAQGTTYAENQWTAPAQPGPVFLWFVLRDARGGITWRAQMIDVQ
jgi:hypothetical protein